MAEQTPGVMAEDGSVLPRAFNTIRQLENTTSKRCYATHLPQPLANSQAWWIYPPKQDTKDLKLE